MSNRDAPLRPSGIQLLGQIPWGTHFCQFYHDQGDLIDVLVPYFRAGLENNEYCMWITAEPLNAVDARKAMEAALPDFVKYEQKGQIEIIPYDLWYVQGGTFDHKRVLDGWISKLENALQQGYEGLRLTGNTFWLEQSDWNVFTEYEKAINDVINKYNIIALCTYSLDRCGAIEILEVMSNHQFALIRKGGEWKIIETSDRKRYEKTQQTIKEHQETIEKAHQNEELVNKVFNLMPVGIFLNDENGNIVRHNEMASIIWGGARDVGVDRYVEYKAYWPGTGNRVKPEEWPGSRVLKEGITILNDTINIETFDGKRKTILCSAAPVLKGQHEVSGSIVIIQDITELKQAERIIFHNSVRNEILADISQKLAEVGLDYQNVLDTIVRKAAERIGDACIIRMLNEDRSRLDVVAYHHPNREARALLGVLHGSVITTIDTAIPGRVVTTKMPVLVPVVPDDESAPVTPGYKEFKEKFGVHSMLAVPLIAHGKAVGMIGMSRDKKGNPYTSDDVNAMQRIADIAALALENARYFQENTRSLERIRYARSLIEASLDPLVTINPEGKITDVNAATVEITGEPRSELIGSDFSSYFTEPEKARSAYQEVFVTGFVKDLSLVIKHTNGKLRHVMYNATVYKNESGEIQGVFADARDVTELKQADQQIRRQAMLLDNASEAITLRDLDNRILYWNKGSEKLYGWNASEVLGRLSHEIIFKGTTQESSTPLYIVALNTVKETREWNGEMIHRDRHGNEIVVDSRWTLIYDEAGKPESILVINRDITEKKRLEIQFLRAQRMESIGTLAGGIAHDLNNILTPIMLSLDLFKVQFRSADNLRLIEMLENNINRASDLVKQVLVFARGAEGERQHVQLKRLITEVEKTIKETFPKKIDVQVTITTDLWGLMGDPTQLHQVLMNLCVNARDAMPDGGVLKIVAENFWIDENIARMNLESKVGPYIILSVIDSGIGMPPNVLNRLFEPFFTTKRLGEGTGLGLSTTRSIVKGHQGFITVYSEAGKGSAFKVHLPAISSKDTFQEEIDQISLLKGNGEHVLVVDDEEPIRNVTISSLQANGYKCFGAGDGSEALALYVQKQNEIDIVIVDMLMPIMDGYASVHALRKLNPRVKIIAVSGISNSSKKFDDSKMVNAFLVKPYTTRKILVMIREVLTARLDTGS